MKLKLLISTFQKSPSGGLGGFFLFLIILFSCQEEDAPAGGNQIQMGSTANTTVAFYTAQVSSTPGSVKGNKIIQHGHCWGSAAIPTVEGSKTALGSLTEAKPFTSELTGLAPNTTYFVRPYLTTDYETIYGIESTVKTLKTGIPAITTLNPDSITTASIKSGGTLVSDSGLVVTEYGLVWDTAKVFSIDKNLGKLVNSGARATYTHKIANLADGVKYHIKAFAKNTAGVGYGNTIEFTTLKRTLATITTSAITIYGETTCVMGGNVASDGNTPVTERGVVYSTSANSITANTKVQMGSGAGSFTQTVTGLTPNTTYYVRAYAINALGTAYGTQISFTTSTQPVTDIDGNIYKTVMIGTQVWMAENLKTTKYNDGSAIPLVTDDSFWANLSSPGYCWYNNDATTYKNTYGALYNWYTVNTGKLCPTGWHVPSDAEWTTLTTYLGGESVAGGKMKEVTGWINPNTGASNSSGFSALPGDYRSQGGVFGIVGYSGDWWSSTEYSYSSTPAWSRNLSYNFSNVYRKYYSKELGFSVRCVRDN